MKTAIVSFLVGVIFSAIVFLSLAFKSLEQLSTADYLVFSATNLRDSIRFLGLSDNELRCSLAKLGQYHVQELTGRQAEEPLLYELQGMNIAGVTNSEITKALELAQGVDWQDLTTGCT